MRNDDRGRRRDDGRYSDLGRGGDRSQQARPDSEASYEPGVPLFEGRQERRNQFERSNYGYSEEPDDYERFGGYGGGRGHGYGTGAGQAGQAGGFERGSPGRDAYERGSDFDDEYGRAYGESGFAGGHGREAYAQRQYSKPVTLPKGYQRSDERIREDICESLSYSGLNVSEVSVEVSNGEVTLSGTVKDRRDKYAIENRADHCLGVRDVENRIRVERG